MYRYMGAYGHLGAYECMWVYGHMEVYRHMQAYRCMGVYGLEGLQMYGVYGNFRVGRYLGSVLTYGGVQMYRTYIPGAYRYSQDIQTT